MTKPYTIDELRPRILLEDLLKATDILLKGTDYYVNSDPSNNTIRVSNGAGSLTIWIKGLEGTAAEIVGQIHKMLEDYGCFGSKRTRFRTYSLKTTTATRR